jgi:hypothetical protein
MSEAPAKKHIALGPESVQEAYDIISAAHALGVELPAPIGTVVYEVKARSKHVQMTADVVFDQYIGIYSSFESGMLALAGLAIEKLESETALYLRPWISNSPKYKLANYTTIGPEENAQLRADWLKGKTLDAIIRSYYGDYTVAKRKVEHEPYKYMDALHRAELGNF